MPAAARTAARTLPARRTSIRWDRLGRLALLGTLIVILLLYISPAKHWLQQSSTAGAQRQELNDLTRENTHLSSGCTLSRTRARWSARRARWAWCARASALT